MKVGTHVPKLSNTSNLHKEGLGVYQFKTCKMVIGQQQPASECMLTLKILKI